MAEQTFRNKRKRSDESPPVEPMETENMAQFLRKKIDGDSDFHLSKVIIVYIW